MELENYIKKLKKSKNYKNTLSYNLLKRNGKGIVDSLNKFYSEGITDINQMIKKEVEDVKTSSIKNSRQENLQIKKFKSKNCIIFNNDFMECRSGLADGQEFGLKDLVKILEDSGWSVFINKGKGDSIELKDDINLLIKYQDCNTKNSSIYISNPDIDLVFGCVQNKWVNEFINKYKIYSYNFPESCKIPSKKLDDYISEKQFEEIKDYIEKNKIRGCFNMTCGIYMIRNKVNGKIYIGQAIEIEGSRWKRHRSELRGNYHGNEHLQRAWNKYGEKSFEFSILLECEENQLNTYEEYYIFELMTYDSRIGYNNTYGGDSGRPTKETKKKISESNKGKIRSEETRKKISEATTGENHPMYGKHHTEETRKKMSEANKGKHLSEETKKKMSESKKGENHPMYGRTGENNPNSKQVVQIDLNTNEVIKVWGSVNEAGRQGFSQGNISECCNGKRKTHKGFRWMYLSDYEKLNEKINLKNH